MRFANFSVLALTGLSIASPVVTKRADAVSILENLYATVQTYTGAINATLAPLSPSSSLLEKAAAIPQVGAQLTLITAAITSTTAEINGLPHADNSTPAVEIASEPASPESIQKRQLVTVGVLLGLIIVEIFATVGAAIAILGLAGLLVFINPLTASLSLLIVTVQIVLNVVLVGVIALLNSVLAALALGLSGL
ncbi:hypothetical protein DE146DRAFT_627763 [Phaeosphaeria sp. MPI-PUGE-AT-0046c]|nr:hypothetical protein DE146DRAFT_627763 [Phaeosphaeria sp. MPI-PUGE-AT-0046c]